MKSIAIKGTLKSTTEGYVIVPATKADSNLLNSYAACCEGKYLNIEFKGSRGTGSLDQKKTAWALINYIFVSHYGRKPTEAERNQTYAELIEEFSDKKQSLLHPDKTTPVTMSEMSKAQLARFISTLVQVLNESAESSLLTNDDIINIQEVFQEFQDYLSLQEYDPTDFDENNQYLSLEAYRKTHTVSYASGRACGEDGSPLEMAHIVSKGSDPAFENCCWNVMMLTHEEHQGIMHGHEIAHGGWNALIARYPHIRGRVERAYNMAKHLYKIINKEEIEL